MFGKNRWAVATLCLAKIIGLLEIVYPSFYSPLGGEALFSYFPRYDHLTLALSNVK